MTTESLAALALADKLDRPVFSGLGWGAGAVIRELVAERYALQRKVQEMALQALADDTQHREVEAERDALLEMLKEARRLVFEWGSNCQDLFDLLPQDLARIDAAISTAMKGTT